MSDAKRFDLHENDMYPASDGAWVYADEYDDVCAENEDLQAELESIKSSLMKNYDLELVKENGEWQLMPWPVKLEGDENADN